MRLQRKSTAFPLCRRSHTHGGRKNQALSPNLIYISFSNVRGNATHRGCDWLIDLRLERGGKVRKSELPTKTCSVCCRPFTWRRSWSRNWDEVRYCSERCRRSRKARAE
ncbi:DUF2256 domain-containing protein [Sedimentitalea sp.]|uniref:DUF2256 domain-containing protein n=1 Tax=Sedimentitalea sp. TaxID=2048915 RepID=UPI003296CEF8